MYEVVVLFTVTLGMIILMTVAYIVLHWVEDDLTQMRLTTNPTKYPNREEEGTTHWHNVYFLWYGLADNLND